MAADIHFTCCAVSAVQPPQGTGWVVTNPPYGVRVSPAAELRNLYAQFGNVLLKLCTGWKAGFLCNSDYLAGHTRIKFDEKRVLINGGIPVRFYLGRVGLASSKKG